MKSKWKPIGINDILKHKRVYFVEKQIHLDIVVGTKRVFFVVTGGLPNNRNLTCTTSMISTTGIISTP